MNIDLNSSQRFTKELTQFYRFFRHRLAQEVQWPSHEHTVALVGIRASLNSKCTLPAPFLDPH
jgi:hypothetical protein